MCVNILYILRLPHFNHRARLADRAKVLGWSEEIKLQGNDAISILNTSHTLKTACMKNISTRGTYFCTTQTRSALTLGSSRVQSPGGRNQSRLLRAEEGTPSQRAHKEDQANGGCSQGYPGSLHYQTAGGRATAKCWRSLPCRGYSECQY